MGTKKKTTVGLSVIFFRCLSGYFSIDKQLRFNFFIDGDAVSYSFFILIQINELNDFRKFLATE
jgi:hypothetical protein